MKENTPGNVRYAQQAELSHLTSAPTAVGKKTPGY